MSYIGAYSTSQICEITLSNKQVLRLLTSMVKHASRRNLDRPNPFGKLITENYFPRVSLQNRGISWCFGKRLGLMKSPSSFIIVTCCHGGVVVLMLASVGSFSLLYFQYDGILLKSKKK